jgi:hypothetical protein
MSFHMLIFLLLLSYEWTLKYSSHSGSPELGNVPQKYRLLAKTPVVDSAIEIMSEEEQTLINATIEVRDGQTIMKFTKLLKDPGQIEIKMGFNNMLWAYGISNTLSYHAERSTFTLDLSPSSDAAVKKILPPLHLIRVSLLSSPTLLQKMGLRYFPRRAAHLHLPGHHLSLHRANHQRIQPN